MKYICLVHVDTDLIAVQSPDEERRMIDATVEHDWQLRDSGHLVFAQPLQPPETAVVLRRRAGKLSRTDGPYAETKEILGGFFVLEAPDLETAIRLAADCPMARYGAVEVRPALEQAHSATGRTRPPLV